MPCFLFKNKKNTNKKKRKEEITQSQIKEKRITVDTANTQLEYFLSLLISSFVFSFFKLKCYAYKALFYSNINYHANRE